MLNFRSMRQMAGILPAGSMLLILFSFPVMAQKQHKLHAGLVKSRGYVVGSGLAASGLHRHDGGQVWTHIGWNLPRVSAIAQDPANPDIIYLACGNGAARTRDGGNFWRMTTDWRVTETQDICVDPHAPQHVYLATAYGIWASKDGADTWREASNGLPKKYTQSLRVDRTRAGRVLAGTEGGLYLSTDGADSWSLLGPPEVTILDLDQCAAAPNVWLAATQDRGVLRSRDNGTTWEFARGSIAHAAIYAVAIDPHDAKNMAAAGWGAGVLVSRDGGATWQDRSAGLPVRNCYETVFDIDQAGRLWVATFEEGIFYSDDFGRTWKDAGMHGAIVFDLVFLQHE
ncbi:MAG: hypothetical protein ONB48_18955 [candidate division KSB1 bacterium]|nr:hypothetical protein [candidate division KSB1 bacterium]MDZ7276320.1 hypothetical protein [candidate division KSB1 bacterium]MDZ7287727.1 hypothetical protein [candidate division KSB1 bacterium]MDZ7299933.1 hypothetical protein [candidate division KSB1 bacterium]MDZ7305738.1 hypothetical protein [candidate division KSB1 bacterium]